MTGSRTNLCGAGLVVIWIHVMLPLGKRRNFVQPFACPCKDGASWASAYHQRNRRRQPDTTHVSLLPSHMLTSTTLLFKVMHVLMTSLLRCLRYLCFDILFVVLAKCALWCKSHNNRVFLEFSLVRCVRSFLCHLMQTQRKKIHQCHLRHQCSVGRLPCADS